VDDIPPQSYGPLIETTVRVITWNVWGRYESWPLRQPAILATLHDAQPDIIVLTESWSKDEDSQCARLAGPLGLPYHAFSGVTAQEDQAALSGVAVLSRWPIRRQRSLTFGCARVQFAELSGPRGPIQVYGLVMDAWWLDESRARQDAVRDLLAHLSQSRDRRIPLVVGGDFNADPDSDEIRTLTGRRAAPAPGLSLCDAWEVAGPPTAGHTWSTSNPHASQLLWPSRRIDYLFSAAPRTGGAGHARRTTLVGTRPVDGIWPSDHFGLQSDLRY
jgi:endonuclease/exonuclease/phosphatase family metal-dependent hydrolase